MLQLVGLRDKGTVGQVIDSLLASHRPRLPENVENENGYYATLTRHLKLRCLGAYKN